MYERIASWLTTGFINREIIPSEKKAVYAYGFEILISNVVYTLVFLAIAILTKSFVESLLFLIGFYIVRSTAGGFHARTYRMCHFLFIINHSVLIVLVKTIADNMYPLLIYGVMLICALIIFVLAPVDHPNKRFSESEVFKFKLRSRIYCVILFSLSLIWFLFFEYNRWCFSYAFGTLSATISLVCAKITHKKRKEK